MDLIHNVVSRRTWLRQSAGLIAGASSHWLLPHLARAADGKRRHKACILLFMNGAPSQHHTFTPPEQGRDCQPIDTALPGVQISEHLPKLAAQLKDWVVIRSMSTGDTTHSSAKYLMHTGHPPSSTVVRPMLGSLASEQFPDADFQLPRFVNIRGVIEGTRSGAMEYPDYGSGYLPPQHAPLAVVAPDRAMEYLKSDLDTDQLAGSVALLDEMQQRFQQARPVDSAGLQRANYQKAIRLMQSGKVQAFDIDKEPASSRARYGDSSFGKACLLSRRLVEAGVPFVEVTFNGWDDHGVGKAAINMKHRGPIMDQAMAALVDDLKQRGLLGSTLVVWMGEFGRSPGSGNTPPGEGHHAKAWTAALAGGGIQAGQVIGKVDARGGEPKDRPVNAPDFFATLCQALALDGHKEYETREGRPMSFLKRTATPVAGLI